MQEALPCGRPPLASHVAPLRDLVAKFQPMADPDQPPERAKCQLKNVFAEALEDRDDLQSRSQSGVLLSLSRRAYA